MGLPSVEFGVLSHRTVRFGLRQPRRRFGAGKRLAERRAN